MKIYHEEYMYSYTIKLKECQCSERNILATHSKIIKKASLSLKTHINSFIGDMKRTAHWYTHTHIHFPGVRGV